jgi:DNA-binding XRE family transcriptional regulator
MTEAQSLANELDKLFGFPAQEPQTRPREPAPERVPDPLTQFTYNTPELAAAKLAESLDEAPPVWVKLGDVGAYLRATREEYGQTLDELEEESGIGRARLSRIENGLHPNPTVQTLVRMAAALDLDLMVTLRPRPGQRLWVS